MIIEKDTILYFSGTGNSLLVARDISEEIKEIELCSIASLVGEQKIVVNALRLGIVFPVYYQRMPLMVDEILKKLIIDKNTYVFAAATYGGAPAEVLVKLKRILQSKGNNLNSGFLFHMPGNNVFYYGPTSIEKQKRMLQKEQKKVINIAQTIIKRENRRCEVSKIVIDIVIDRLFIKTTDKIMQNLHKRDDKFWVNDKCISCKLCEKICPARNIEFIENRLRWRHNCEQCTACIQYCPKEAIQWGKKTEKRKRYRNINVSVNELMNK